MKLYLLLPLGIGAALSACSPDPHTPAEVYAAAATNTLRAPATPLVTIDPYTSAWSFADNLYDEGIRHWSGRDFPLIGALRVDGEAYRVMGEKVELKPIIAMAATGAWDADYVFTEPAGEWQSPGYDASAWKKGKAAFGTEGNPHLATTWEDGEIWVRRTFDWPDSLSKENLYLQFSHDDNIEVYINGIETATTGNGLAYDLMKELPEEVIASLKPEGNVLAAHCRNNGGGAYVDMGIMQRVNIENSFAREAVQKSCTVMPTQTYYTFECGPVGLDLIFTAPFIPDDMQALTSPYNYITYQVRSLDGDKHDVQFYLEATPHWAVNFPDQDVTFNMEEKNGYMYLSTGTESQEVLGRKGDDVRIDWGYFYLSGVKAPYTSYAIDEFTAAKMDFMADGSLAGKVGATCPDMEKQMTVLAYSDNLGKVGKDVKAGHLLVGYDDIESIEYFGDHLQPIWKDGGRTIFDAMEAGDKAYNETMKRCAEFDAALMEEATKAGGEKYAELCALSYRQAMAAHKPVYDKNGELLYFSKENFSNGSIGTVDITYPSAPMYLIYNPELLKGMMNPIFHYSESGQWNKPFPAHDVGTYPIANGQTYSGDMPVEESGNMLILTAALAEVEGNADYAAKHWETLSQWAEYLAAEGLDPANQLCTDDFAGHFAHNANLSLKAIMGVASYARLAGLLGKDDIMTEYITKAGEMAEKWQKMAADGDHYRLTFDRPGSWSQKYNLIWDKMLGFEIFPEEIAQTEMAYYKTHQNKYGLPLDIRKDYTKSDWILWTACLTENPDDFEALMNPVWNYVNETSSRVPFSDWYITTDGTQQGFQARSVVAGHFMRMLQNRLQKNKE